MNANWSRNAFVYLLIIVAAATLFINIYQPGDAPQQISLTQLATKIKAGEIDAASVKVFPVPPKTSNAMFSAVAVPV